MPRRRYVRHRRLKKKVHKSGASKYVINWMVNGVAHYFRNKEKAKKQASYSQTYTDTSALEDGIALLITLLTAALIWGIVLMVQHWAQIKDTVLPILGILVVIGMGCFIGNLILKSIQHKKQLMDIINSPAPELVYPDPIADSEDFPQLVQIINQYGNITADVRHKQALIDWHQGKAEAYLKLRNISEHQACLNEAEKVVIRQKDDYAARSSLFAQFRRDFLTIEDEKTAYYFDNLLDSLAESAVSKASLPPLFHNIEIPVLRKSDTSNIYYFFLRDNAFILDMDTRTISGIEYSKMRVDYEVHKIPMRPDEVPPNATLDGITFLHTCKDGTMDLRYTENPMLQLVQQGVITLYDSTHRLYLTMDSYDIPASQMRHRHIQLYFNMIER